MLSPPRMRLSAVTLRPARTGTNNIGNVGHKAAPVADGVALLLDTLRAKLPATKILVMATFPRSATRPLGLISSHMPLSACSVPPLLAVRGATRHHRQALISR